MKLFRILDPFTLTLITVVLPLFALSLSVSITGCDQKNDTLQGKQNNMTAFIKKIAASKES
ncbi:hypothetical protein MJN51_40620, partial [Salmonella enterica subsp. enterica serovar Kentucky]|nr:hypothetical protein [Salmonella enterica subsp. enterica serovar Kentucky]